MKFATLHNRKNWMAQIKGKQNHPGLMFLIYTFLHVAIFVLNDAQESEVNKEAFQTK